MWKAAFKKMDLKFFKGCLPQILIGPFLNTLTHIFSNDASIIHNIEWQKKKMFLKV